MAETTWTQSAGMVSDEDTDNLESYSEQAEASKDAAAVSAAAAEAAKVAAAASEAAALASKNSAATSATTAATGAATATTKASEAAASAASASTSATDAQTAQTAAEAAETAAAASEATVAASAAAASTSETNAASSASAASTSETNAATSETNAATSASASATSATASASSATAASASETAAATSATAASASETAAATSETNAAASAATATTKASEASASATAAASSASASATSATDSESARDQSQAARDTANLHKLAAEAAATSATSTAAALTGFDLNAIAETKGVTAVDVFVYDTSKDSDGGAWRKRTQGTSWYNEALNTNTRGSRREFPAVAVIVAENTKVTIYDGDDPSLPMWMVFNRSTSNPSYMMKGGETLAMLNGNLVSGGTGGWSNGISLISFLSDASYWSTTGSYRSYFSTSISGRNSGSYPTAILASVPLIVDNSVNDVAMTVLPDAPIDPATGLPVPTIAVATNGGTSVIQDDGTVYDITRTGGHDAVAIIDTDKVIVSRKVGGNDVYVHQLPLAADTTDYTGDVLQYGTTGNIDIGLATANNANLVQGAVSGADGVAITAPNYANPNSSMFALTTSTYNTGWMNGDIKGAFLSDTDDTDLVEQASIIPNGDFSAADTFWTINADSTSQVVAGQLEVTATANFGGVIPAGSTAYEGGWYWVEADLISGTGRFDFLFVGNDGDFPNINRTGPYSYRGYVMLRESDGYFQPRLRTSVSGTTTVWDNFRMVKVDADRSVNANGLIVNGTVTRTPVATGADLVAYSGFSASNYLEQPYNSDLDFGTGDFCIMGWVKATVATQCIFEKGVGQTGFSFELFSDGFLAKMGNSYIIPNTDLNIANGMWRHVAAVRRSNTFSFVLDGVETYSISNSKDISAVDHASRIGVRTNGSRPADSLSLLRISATAPTAEQIAKIYKDEKVLFQENAGAVLAGTSDAVTALAYDDDTQELLVGTSQNTSVFRGLRRVETISGSASAISASNGLRVIED